MSVSYPFIPSLLCLSALPFSSPHHPSLPRFISQLIHPSIHPSLSLPFLPCTEDPILDVDEAFLGANPTVAKKRKVRLKRIANELFDQYTFILVCKVDNVGSKQLQNIRRELRGRAALLLGKKSLLRKVIRDNEEKHPRLQALLPHLTGNVGLLLTSPDQDLRELRDLVSANKVPAAAKTGIIAPQDVFVGPGSTGLDPGQTSFFQAVNIATKIVRGSIEIQNRVHLVQKGTRVSASAVALLAKMNLRPFAYGVEVLTIYEDGVVYDASILDLTEKDITEKFMNGVRYLASISLASQIPTAAALPHYIANTFQRLLAIALVTEITFEEAEPFKEYLANPDAFKAAAPAAAEEAPEEAAAPEEESEDESEMEEFSLFD